MPLPKHQYDTPGSRVLEVLAGLIMAGFGVGLFALVAYAAYIAALRSRFQPGDLWIFAALAIIGGFCSLVAWRLVLNRPRHDRGLFGPGFLRFGGIILLLGGLLTAVFHFPYGLFHLAGAMAASAACFALARSRTEQTMSWPVDGKVS